MLDGKAAATQPGNISPDDYGKLISTAKPAVTGSQVLIAVDQDTIDNIVGPIIGTP